MPVIYILASVVILVTMDQALKIWITNHIALGTTDSWIPGIMSLTNLHNSGAAWSILEGQQWLFTIITAIAIGAIIYGMFKVWGKGWYLTSMTILLSGIIGNYINRLLDGYVVDMFQTDFINFPVFNFADICITFGIIMLFYSILKDGDLN
jgi:signal peptidase II